ncbi:Chitin synthase regulatory factor 3 [Pleurostoma richardsiae]|uniref:Chitin synthase regulatory factor 3 n=1 Tax=Pleurostoma richardsiae TaxID=41990 RepID=A0AA38S3P7_9PEZI|nr:Chitin synthase regulatory factor 3 [Pleurostoma richardsiae]
MAYDGGYQGQQRPYNGPVAPRPAPQRQYPAAPGPDQYGAPQQFDQYQDDYSYGYDQYGGGNYDQGFSGQYGDANYAPRGPPNQNYPPQRDYYGPGPNGGPGGGRPPIPGGRGAPMQRPPTADGPRVPYPGPPGPGRGYPPNGPPGRGRPPPPDRTATSDPSMNRPRVPMNDSRSPVESGFGGGPFPAFPGHNRKTDLDEEHQVLDQMGAMDISGTRQAPPSIRSQGSQGSQRGPRVNSGDDYGRPPMDGRGPPRGYPPPGAQGYPDQRRGFGPDRYSDYQEEPYGPPPRTMTMPNNPPPMGMRDIGLPRADSAPYNGPLGRGMPARPSTSQGSRPPPQRMYPPNQGPPQPQEGQYQNQDYDYASVDSGYGPSLQQRPASFDDVYDSYYDGQRPNGYPQSHRPSDPPDFNAAPPGARSSFDQSMQAGPMEQGQRGPGRFPEVSRTKSQPDLRQPQAAVFEMAGDIPPVPSMPNPGQGYPGQRPSFEQPPPNGPVPPQAPGLPSNPAAMRAGSQRAPSQGSINPDGLPSHPTPVRPGLMPNSLVSQMGSKPAPVRNYGGTPPGGNNPVLPPIQSAAEPRPSESQTPVTSDELERLRTIVKASPQDQDMALRLAKRLIEASDVLVPNIPDPKCRGRARERYLMDAHKILKKLANATNPGAMFVLADNLGRGMFGGEPDNKEAFTLYQSAAKLGHAAAAYRTAVCCEIGNEEGGGTRKDPLKAIQWYKRAATLGDTPAMYKVGMILLKGLLGQPKNPREAVSWLKRAAERADTENPHALHELGLLYESAQPNDVIIRDEPYALTLFRQAAELGYKFSQFRLGCAHEYGLMGCPIDPRLSIMWYSKAAQQDEHQSELALSGWYLTGSDGVLGQNDTEAYLWARKAAMAGLAKAEYAMGYFTEVGIGVPANLEDAKRWYWRAAAQDFPKARERLEELKRSGKSGPRQRERISRSKIGKQQEGECVVM